MVKLAPELHSPLCVALDSTDRDELERLAKLTRPSAGIFKVGLGAFCSLGPGVVVDLARHRPVFLDLKLHDIPAQVAGAAGAAQEIGAAYITVHAGGGPEMVAAAAAAAPDCEVLGVTVLTSLDQALLARLGVSAKLGEQVVRLAEIALEGGAAGLVCSPLEVAQLRSRFGVRDAGGPLLVTPGIRGPQDVAGDQRRTLSAPEARAAGADIVVVGRPISAAPDPAAAAASLRAQLAR
ncbi:MAG: orotidine-5'-phosphate decarboxylase [Actinomycetota bacterium]|nr:orotidine-5'-phosphate decarboxylase [Actinomycetota bacterium]